MMNDAMKDIVAVLMALIGVAILVVLVRQSSNTSGVIRSASGGFSQMLATAMGSNSHG